MRDGWSPDEVIRAASAVQGGLKGRLGRVVGDSGVNVLFVRAIRLTQVDHPCLKGLNETASDLTNPLRTCRDAHRGYEQESVHVQEIAESLLTTFLEVLVSLLGEKLTSRLLHDMWPTEEPKAP